nr:hypothetical protein [Mycoplasmopsis bovis]
MLAIFVTISLTLFAFWKNTAWPHSSKAYGVMLGISSISLSISASVVNWSFLA